MDNLNIDTLQLSRKHLPTLSDDEQRMLTIQNSDWQAILGGARLSEAELQGLKSMQSLRCLGSGEIAFTRHQPAKHLVAVLKGSVGLGLARDDEPFHLERTVHGPHWLDPASAWLGGRYAQDARAVSEAWLIDLPLNRMRELMAAQPAMVERMLKGVAQEVHSLTGMTHDLMHKDAEHRLAIWLLQHCQPEDKACRELSISLKERKRDIAAQLAITPETLSRMMRQLNRKGVIEVQGYSIKVLDLPALKALAQD
jgi:CRP-like cAMP-binding protein